jgi:hypothetical protein
MLSSTVKRSVATLGVVAGLLVAAVPAGAAVPGGTTPGQPNDALRSATTAVTPHGIIMRDGGICDPIRHMGC